MGAHIVAAGSMYPEPWPTPKASKLLFVGGSVLGGGGGGAELRSAIYRNLPQFTAIFQ